MNLLRRVKDSSSGRYTIPIPYIRLHSPNESIPLLISGTLPTIEPREKRTQVPGAPDEMLQPLGSGHVNFQGYEFNISQADVLKQSQQTR
jgi:hypothetical protein